MPGYSAVPVISDAILKGIGGFDTERAYRAMKASTTYPLQDAVPFVLENEFIPDDKAANATSIAMEYAVGDWGVAQVAKKFGNTADYEEYLKRGKYYTHYFDKSINFIRPKLENGEWLTPTIRSSRYTAWDTSARATAGSTRSSCRSIPKD